MTRKLIRGVGLALIAMPEPITTPIGVSLLAVSWVMARRHDAQKRAYLRHILQEYLHTYKPFGYGVDTKTVAHSLNRIENTSFYDRGKGPSRVGFGGYAWPGKSKKELQPVYHSFDRSEIRKRLCTGGSRQGHEGYWGRKSYIEIKPVYHTIQKTLALA